MLAISVKLGSSGNCCLRLDCIDQSNFRPLAAGPNFFSQVALVYWLQVASITGSPPGKMRHWDYHITPNGVYLRHINVLIDNSIYAWNYCFFMETFKAEINS